MMSVVMSLNITKMAPGSNDAWITFWGSYLGAGISALLAGAIAYFVANNQVKIQAENDLKRGKLFFYKKIKIEKTQEVVKCLNDYLRTIALLEVRLIELLTQTIKHEEFKKQNNFLQNEVTIHKRFLLTNKVFTEKYENYLTALRDEFDLICDKIYEGYQNPNPPKKRYTNEEVTYDKFKNSFNNCINTGITIIDLMNNDLKNELEDLK